MWHAVHLCASWAEEALPGSASVVHSTYVTTIGSVCKSSAFTAVRRATTFSGLCFSMEEMALLGRWHASKAPSL